MKKALGGLLALALLLGACSGNPQQAPAAGSDAKQGQPAQAEPDSPGVTRSAVKVGAWLPLTGPAANYGVQLRAGLDSYYKMINEKGGVNGRKIEFVVEDTDRDPQKTVAGARKLIERDQVFALTGVFGTGNSAAAHPFVLDEAQVPIVNTYGGQLNWYNPPKPNLFGVMSPYEDQGKAMGRWAAKNGAVNLVAVHNDPVAYEQVANQFEPGARSFNPNARVTKIPVKLGTRDYVPIVLQLINLKPDAVGFFGPLDEFVLMAKELERQNVKIPLYTYAANVSNDTISLGGTAVEGMRAMSFTVPPTADSPAVDEYRQALKKYYPDQVPDFMSLMGWSFAKTFVEALSRVKGPLTRANLIKSLESLNQYETGILPPVTFSATRRMGVTGMQPMRLEKGVWKLEGGFIDPNTNW